MLGTVTDLPTTFEQRNIEGEPTNNLQNQSVIASFQYFTWNRLLLKLFIYYIIGITTYFCIFIRRDQDFSLLTLEQGEIFSCYQIL